MPHDQTAIKFGLSARAHRAVDQPISYLMAEALRRPGLISLAAGFVDYHTLPAEPIRRLCDELLADTDAARAALQYGTTLGYESLRETLYEHMASLDGLSVTEFPGSPEQVIVTTGSQQLLHILADLLINPGDIVITCWPSYFVYTGALTAFGAVVRGVDMDDDGIIPDALEATLQQIARDGHLHRVKMLYLCPYHQNPTGLSLSAERRPIMLDLVKRYSQKADQRILLVEDAAYRELNYAPPGSSPGSVSGALVSRPLRSIKHLDTDNQYVALLQTFSKPFAPGLKTGYGLLPDDLVDPAIIGKGGRDFGSSNLIQHLLDRAMRTGVYAEQVRTLCDAYAVKRDAMLAALDQHFTDIPGATWTKPTGGLYIWLTLPGVDTGRHGKLFPAALDAGMLFVPGEYCYPDDPTRTVPTDTIRLSFGVPTTDQIHEGIARLAQAVKVCLNP